jgi:SAM-dependent methyltransferase
MGFSWEWDMCYRDQKQLTIWPWSDLISLVYRYCNLIISNKEGSFVLELGCGAGANIPFFTNLKLNYQAIEGSPQIVQRLHERFPDLNNKIKLNDFTIKGSMGRNAFDLIFDRAAVTHNNTESIIITLGNIFDALKVGGIFIGIDWFSTKHSDYRAGDIIDHYTRTNYSYGQFVGIGNVHFSDESHLRALFKDFHIIYLEEKIIKRREPSNNHKFSSWNIVVEKLS